MIELELKAMSYGWKGTDIPDNIEYLLRAEDGTPYELTTSLQQLAILYASIADKTECSFFMGTGTPVEVQHSNDKVQVQIGNITITEKEKVFSKTLDGLLKDIFEIADQKDPSVRDRNLDQINKHLQKYYNGFDFKSVYESLSQ